MAARMLDNDDYRALELRKTGELELLGAWAAEYVPAPRAGSTPAGLGVRLAEFSAWAPPGPVACGDD